MKYNIVDHRLCECLDEIKNEIGEIHIVEKFKEGRNNLVLKLSDNYNYYVLKIYSRRDNYNLEKLKREEYFLKYMRKNHIHNVPLLIKSNSKKMYILINIWNCI